MIIFLPYGLNEDGSLISTDEPTAQQMDELAKFRYAAIGSRNQYKSGDSWDVDRIDQWLRETLPLPFERLDIAAADLPDHKHQWRLLKTRRSHPELHCEMPDRYDVKSVKWCKSKGWQDTKLFFVTCILIPEIIEAMEDIAVQAQKGKGKAVCKRRAADADSDDDVFVELSTCSKKQKVTRKNGLSNSDDDYVMPGPLEKVRKGLDTTTTMVIQPQSILLLLRNHSTALKPFLNMRPSPERFMITPPLPPLLLAFGT
ncbi:hypothetical protein JB92DRAFT_3008900 [Gautieria morchelliformis]|nr:hypothetical protein JB92DRAFT_3008900 [Gautieria morchelliformis]